MDAYSILFGEEPDQMDYQRALVDALRGKRQENDFSRAAGNLGLLTGDRVLSQFGQAQLQGAARGDENLQQREQLLAQAGQHRLTRTLEALKMKQAQDDRLADNRRLDSQLSETGRHNRAMEDKEGMQLRRAMEAQTAQRETADKKRITDTEEGLRKELTGLPSTKAFQEVAVSYDKIIRAAKEPSAAGDLSLLTGYMKLIDPGSSVKEGEFANAQNASGVPERIVVLYNNLRSGQRLTPEMRADFLRQSQNLYAAHAAQYDKYANQYRGLASKYGVAPDNVVLGSGSGPTAQQPQAGPDVMMLGNKRLKLQADGTYLPE